MRALRLTQQQVQAIVNHALSEAPHEACGLLAGTCSDDSGRARLILPLPNQAESPRTQYSVPPGALLEAYQTIDAQGLSFLGGYHSHPGSPPIPSPDDVREAERNSPGAVHLIISLKDSRPALKAWQITPGSVQPVELLIGVQPAPPNVPLSNLQKYAIIIVAVLAVLVLWWISFSLLPPAPPIPTS